MKQQTNEIKNILSAYSQRPVAYMPIYAKITGSVTAGILLSQIVYWWYATGSSEFYKTDQEWTEELSFGLYELQAAKKKLASLKLDNGKYTELRLLKITRRGVPARTYYELREEALVRLITSYWKNPELDMGKTRNKTEEKPITYNKDTENNTENNTESTMRAKARPEVTVDSELIVDENPSQEIVEKAGKRLAKEIDDKNGVNAVVEVFYRTVNPAINYGNKTTRSAAEWLIKKYGLEKTIKMAEFACQIQGQPYTPTITTPYQLKENLGKLIVYAQKQANKPQSGVLKI